MNHEVTKIFDLHMFLLRDEPEGHDRNWCLIWNASIQVPENELIFFSWIENFLLQKCCLVFKNLFIKDVLTTYCVFHSLTFMIFSVFTSLTKLKSDFFNVHYHCTLFCKIRKVDIWSSSMTFRGFSKEW